MISREQALQFADEWVAAWNAHDLDAVLSHYTDDFEMSSPFILQMGISPDGRLKGKENVRNYWEKAMAKYPDLHFDLHEVLSCMNTVILYYTSVSGKKAAEYFVFNEDGKVFQAMGHYN
ncbi:nuclear transport factor 2 family protein [Chitinophaga filiformis]|uniref:Nuclear transport factor 2 family protein n=1 Tax=Chitinophaga filiformis TaxID=104663 RepID=A0ABY4HWC3_CHIFI|nr:nuclear transport factor 2 family protein [Chitinophaga filiformis]UPK68089.1 nuclear transport factor 2 family protein [Chitinophaga filiformis]